MTYILEGEWSGYNSNQQRIVHREVISSERYKNFQLKCIIYTDGTRLDFYLHEQSSKNVLLIDGYDCLIRDAEKLNKPIVYVSELN